MNKEFWVDFQGSIKIKASNWEAAKEKVIGILSNIDVKYLQVDDVKEIKEDD